ncbi:hypothetical protein AYJ11_17070 [Enterobacter hormaechei subsp. xiangfangensis]|nr:hypothetical protein AYJ11_17070 [Enterobacter hormaechei subsp. xiangfangensis]
MSTLRPPTKTLNVAIGLTMKIDLMSGAVATGYLLICSSLYLWVFWLHFDINILQFIDAADIIKAAAIPSIPLIFILIFNIAIQQYNIVDTETRERYKEAGGGFKAYSYAASAYIVFIALCAIGALGFAVYKVFTGSLPTKYASAALLIGCFSAYYLIFKVKLFKEWGDLRFLVIAFLCYFPSHLMHLANEDAKNIIVGKDTFLVSSNLSCTKNEREKYRYIATLSDKVFSLNLSDGSLCVQRYEFLTLKREKNAKSLLGYDAK